MAFGSHCSEDRIAVNTRRLLTAGGFKLVHRLLGQETFR